jgi:hypothetical protein
MQTIPLSGKASIPALSVVPWLRASLLALPYAQHTAVFSLSLLLQMALFDFGLEEEISLA